MSIALKESWGIKDCILGAVFTSSVTSVSAPWLAKFEYMVLLEISNISGTFPEAIIIDTFWSGLSFGFTSKVISKPDFSIIQS